VEALDALARTPLFQGVPPERLAFLAPRLRRETFKRGSIVYLEGDPSDVIQIVIGGCVKISKVSADGGEIIIMFARPGDTCGLPAALVDGARRATQGEATEDSVLLALDRESLYELLEREPLVMRRVLENVASMARFELDAHSGVAFLDLPARVAMKLLDLAEEFGEPADGGTRIARRVSQRDLAGMVAASREKVNRVLAGLVEEGAIRQEAGHITILDPARLRAHG
jgi:CRP-like cAMP-binding protein